MRRPISLVVEGPTDAAVAERLLTTMGLPVGASHIQNGKGKLDQRLNAFNAAARISPWLVLRDLDQDEPCAAALVRRLLPRPSKMMRFRIAVRKSEAWILADRDGLARFLGVRENSIPEAPDGLPDPKATLVKLAQKARAEIRRDMVPKQGLTAPVGPAYSARIIEFVHRDWSPTRAARCSDSLRRAMDALRTLR